MSKQILHKLVCIGAACSIAIMPYTGYANEIGEEPSSHAYSNITDEQIAEIIAAADNEAGISPYSATTSLSMESYSGFDRYETSALQAKTWKSCSHVVICNGERFPDALAASSLAGALSCPILLTNSKTLSGYTRDALQYLKGIGMSRAFVMGGTDVISDTVINQINGMGISVVKRIYGKDRYGTQLELFKYGKSQGYWKNNLIVMTTGSDHGFGDALSASPLAYSEKAPVFLVPDSGTLTSEQQSALKTGTSYGRAILVGGPVRIKTETREFAKTIANSVEGVYGSDRYATSAQLAIKTVELGYLHTNNAAFASGEKPWDALGGGALQGRDRSVLVLANVYNAGNAIAAIKPTGASVVRFFGGTDAVSQEARTQIMNALGDPRVSYKAYNIAMNTLVQIEARANTNYTQEQISGYLDPNGIAYGTPKFYQFAILSNGYSGVTAQQLDDIIAKQCEYQEKTKGVTSKLRGQGKAFVEAARKYGINEVYLLSHAALESAWGCSSLAQGTVKGYEGYYNFYGIGAYDIDPNNGGAALAKKENWNNPAVAIDGAAAWIAKNYIKPTVSSAAVSGSQNTLYKMRWDVNRAIAQGTVWHQYATAGHWATSIAEVMASIYSSLGKNISDTGLMFEVPIYR